MMPEPWPSFTLNEAMKKNVQAYILHAKIQINKSKLAKRQF